MAFNIMDMITDQLTPDNIGVLSKFLGEDSSMVTKALSAAAPMLLSSMLGSTSKPEGKELFNQNLEKADSGFMGNMASALAGDGGGSMASSGLSMLTSLFGDNKLGAMIKALTSFGGMSSNSSKSLLGLAAPMLMGMLSKKKNDDGLDSGGLLSMLMGQKKNIANAISPDMGKAFSGLGIMDNLGDIASQTSDTVKDVANAAGNTVKDAANVAGDAVQDVAQDATVKGKSLFSKLWPFLAIALLLWLAYLFFMKPSSETVSTSVKQTGTELAQSLTIGNKDLGKTLTDTFNQTTKLLSSVTDTNSANTAVNGLNTVSKNLDSITRLAAQLPPQGKSVLATIANKLIVILDQNIASAYQIPGVRNILEGSVSGVKQQLTQLANL